MCFLITFLPVFRAMIRASPFIRNENLSPPLGSGLLSLRVPTPPVCPYHLSLTVICFEYSISFDIKRHLTHTRDSGTQDFHLNPSPIFPPPRPTDVLFFLRQCPRNLGVEPHGFFIQVRVTRGANLLFTICSPLPFSPRFEANGRF